MAVTAYRMIKLPIDQIERFMTEFIADGWQPYGAPLLLQTDDKAVYQAIVKGAPDGGGAPGDVSIEDITDASAVGKSLLGAADAAAARTAIGAGTSSLALGTSGTTAAAGNHNHAITADTGSGLAAAANIQELAVALSSRIKVLEDAAG